MAALDPSEIQPLSLLFSVPCVVVFKWLYSQVWHTVQSHKKRNQYNCRGKRLLTPMLPILERNCCWTGHIFLLLDIERYESSSLCMLFSNLFLLGFGTCRPLILSYAFVRSLCLSHCFLPGLLYVCSSYQLPWGRNTRTHHEVLKPRLTPGDLESLWHCTAV